MNVREYLDLRDKDTPWQSMCILLADKLSEYDGMNKEKLAVTLYKEVDEFFQKLSDNIQFKYDLPSMIEEASEDDDLIHFVCTSTMFANITIWLEENYRSTDDLKLTRLIKYFQSETLTNFLLTCAFSCGDKNIIKVYLSIIQIFYTMDIESVIIPIEAFVQNVSDEIYVEALLQLMDTPSLNMDKLIKEYY